MNDATKSELRRDALKMASNMHGPAQHHSLTVAAAKAFYEYLAGEGEDKTPEPTKGLPNPVDVAHADEMVLSAAHVAEALRNDMMRGVRSRFESEGSIESQQHRSRMLTTTVLQEMRRFHAHHLAIIDAELALRKAL